jgi:endonuclease YncB( thermonuclease family)
MVRCACFLFLTLFSATLAAADPSGVIRVIDGDTFDVGGERVRLHGIDAVEVGQTCRSAQGVRWDCGTYVQDEVRARYQGQRATCKTHDVDRYGRIVAKCFVAGRDVGAELVADGFALAYVKYSRDYVTVEKSASVQNRGFGQTRTNVPPWRAKKRPVAVTHRTQTVRSKATSQRMAASITCPAIDFTRARASMKTVASAGFAPHLKRSAQVGGLRGNDGRLRVQRIRQDFTTIWVSVQAALKRRNGSLVAI